MAVVLKSAVLLTLCCYAVETYPAESCGFLLASRKGQNYNVAQALSLQLAVRKGNYEVVYSKKSKRAFNWASEMARGEKLKTIDGHHSHPSKMSESLVSRPSGYDISEMTMGHFELIVALRRTRKINTNWNETKLGLTAVRRKYQFVIRCFQKIARNQVKELKLVLTD